MRCPACGARNRPDAAWCTQCYEPTTAEARRTGVAAGERGVPAADAPPAATRDVGDGDVRDRDVRDRDGEVEWRCGACGTWSPLLAPTCAGCGTPRTGFGEAPPRRDVHVGAGAVLVASGLLPGLGHVLAGRLGTGLARALLFVLWAAGGLVLLRGTGGAAGGTVLVLGALVVWAASLVDVTRLDTAHPPLLGPRRLGMLVLVVTSVLLVAGMLATPGADTEPGGHGERSSDARSLA